MGATFLRSLSRAEPLTGLVTRQDGRSWRLSSTVLTSGDSVPSRFVHFPTVVCRRYFEWFRLEKYLNIGPEPLVNMLASSPCPTARAAGLIIDRRVMPTTLLHHTPSHAPGFSRGDYDAETPSRISNSSVSFKNASRTATSSEPRYVKMLCCAPDARRISARGGIIV
jgi:hypothetical protein